MPTYEYQCEKCKKEFETFKTMCGTDEDFEECPDCKVRAHRKIGAGGGIIFYGPGFYATDNRSIKDAQTPGVAARRKKKKSIVVPVTDRRTKR